MARTQTFEARLLNKVHEQVTGRNTGFLLGAGASYLNGRGYPLASGLWPAIRDRTCGDDQRIVDDRVAGGCATLEEALDTIDQGRTDDLDLRHRITAVIAEVFAKKGVPMDFHRSLAVRLASRQEKRVPVFTLNYDSLLEQASDAEQLTLLDGFCGTVESYFHPVCFIDFRGHYESRRGRTVSVPYRGVINLYKLHGSLGWYVDQDSNLKRIRPDMPCPNGWRHLMIPPQNRKAADTGITPYATLWSELRAYLANDKSRLLNRLVCVGYGFGDGHVNAMLDAALQREHFTLIVLTRALSDQAFNKYAASAKALVVSETRSSLYGEQGPGLANAWSFEWLSKEV